MTAAEALRRAADRLEAAGVPGAVGDARRLLALAMGIAPGRLTLHLPDTLDAQALQRFEALTARRACREPVSHLLGRRAFYGRDFRVGPDVLDPRPETETLISAALVLGWQQVLDLGTGSGCILLTLLAERPGAEGIGSDLSPAALAVAHDNAGALGLEERVRWTRADWWDGITGRFDLIVSNPPYIAADEMADLAPELTFEPRMALTDEGDGLGAYRIIAHGASAYLEPGGWLMLEIGHRQGADVAALLHKAGLRQVETRPDLDGRDRAVMGRKPL